MCIYINMEYWPEYSFNKVAGLTPAVLLKNILGHTCFPVNFAKFLKNTFFIEHLQVTALETLTALFTTVTQILDVEVCKMNKALSPQLPIELFDIRYEGRSS